MYCPSLKACRSNQRLCNETRIKGGKKGALDNAMLFQSLLLWENTNIFRETWRYKYSMHSLIYNILSCLPLNHGT